MRLAHVRGLVLTVAALFVVAGLLTGCRSNRNEPAEAAQSSDETVDVTPPPALTGTSWIVESLGEGADQVESLPDVQSSLGFLVDRYGGNGGCNYYVGVYSAQGAELTLESPARTGASCTEEPASLTQENVFMSALATTARYAVVDGNLELFASNGQLMLTLAPLEPAPLQGTEWSLQFVNVETQWEVTIPDSQITLRIEDGQITGTSGCNSYQGTVDIEDGTIVVTELSFTEMACQEPEGVMEQETLYLSLLEQVALVRQFPQSLELLGEDGSPLLLFGATDAE